MASALFIFGLWHPGQVLIGPESDFPKKVKKTKAEKNAEKADKKARKEKSLNMSPSGFYEGNFKLRESMEEVTAPKSVAGGLDDSALI